MNSPHLEDILSRVLVAPHIVWPSQYPSKVKVEAGRPPPSRVGRERTAATRSLAQAPPNIQQPCQRQNSRAARRVAASSACSLPTATRERASNNTPPSRSLANSPPTLPQSPSPESVLDACPTMSLFGQPATGGGGGLFGQQQQQQQQQQQ